jgi:hypothetical protein
VVNVKERDSVGKILDMVPDIINKFVGSSKKKDDNLDEKIKEAVNNCTEETVDE